MGDLAESSPAPLQDAPDDSCGLKAVSCLPRLLEARDSDTAMVPLAAKVLRSHALVARLL